MFSKGVLKLFKVKVDKNLVRYKHSPDHWSVLRKKVHPTDKALNHFDDFYKRVFDDQWWSIRKALLGRLKYVAVLNNFGDDEKTAAELELTGAMNVRKLFKLEKGYIREEATENKRKSASKEIYRLDEEMELEHCSNPANVKENMNHSLESGFTRAEYDMRRLVNSKSDLSSEILHEFIPATKIKGMEDFIPESNLTTVNFDVKLGVKIEREYDLHFPEHLNVYCYEIDNRSSFEPPRRGSTGVFNYYVMDGGSLLPVLALDLKPGHRVLDMCAAPGGKSLLALQTLYPSCVVSNDVSNSRLNRISNVYSQFLYDFTEKWLETGKIRLTNVDGRSIVEDNFDRILVDVPCTTDRHSLHENDNNIFKPSRIKERLLLPELQKELLVNALKLVRKGGVVVYSTCSLSPIQNDGVVNVALRQIWEETSMEIIIKDLTPALLQARRVYKFADIKLLKYGHLVLPTISQNYGPTYFCKLQKIK